MEKESVLINRDSLVKYNNPTLLRSFHESSDRSLTKCCKFTQETFSKSEQTISALQSTAETDDLQEILNWIIPPREWEENNEIWRQTVSHEPATRGDVTKLWEQLEIGLQKEQARLTGICPVRRRLFTQCFDEIIRQVSVTCPDRGLLLLRARDELRRSLDTYKTVFEHSVQFSLKKAMDIEQQSSGIYQITEEEKELNADLERQLARLHLQLKLDERTTDLQKKSEQKRFSDEIEFMKKTNQTLKAQYEGIVIVKK